ncbi:MAG: ABC transporter substrate-binding protein [Anaerolineales bacterium]|nr:ABC transporter substrate-binding protein [Anaerolineales bacterium]
MRAPKYAIRNTQYVFRIPYSVFRIAFLFLLSTFYFLLTSCLPITRPVVKIGLVAPFEGRYRNLGYEVIYAVRLAVREANAAGGVAGYSVELSALDDSGDPEMAAEQARKLATDPQVVAVLGHWLDRTTAAAASEYEQLKLPLLVPVASAELPDSVYRLWASPCMLVADSGCFNTWEELSLAGNVPLTLTSPIPLPSDSTDPAFAERYLTLSNGVEPRFAAVLAYDAAHLLLDAIARDIATNGAPSRNGVQAQLAQTNYAGLSGLFSFDADREWRRVGREWMKYVWREGELLKP